MIDFYTKGVSRKVGGVCKRAVEEGYDAYAFLPAWLTSETFQRLLELEVCELGQSAYYQLNSFLMEMGARGIQQKMSASGSMHEDRLELAEAMYWAGYLFAYWCFRDGITGNKLVSQYDISRVLDAYDTLHTLSCKSAIEDIESDFRIAA